MQLAETWPSILGPIQAATAPVVLISGIGLLLLTLTGRLGRIVDRARLLDHERRSAPELERPSLDAQLAVLGQRARLVRRSILLSASAIVCLAILIAVLFTGLLFHIDVAIPSAILFIASIGCLVVGLLAFVRELFQALTALELSLRERR